uniref:Carboxylesterase type B domain-containing protein n=1 Tax=Cercocebus atys TaxID=9531 RepID=A0A2K5KYU5_CERAT
MWLRALVLGTLAASTVWGHPSSPPVVDTVHGKVLGKFVSLEGFAQPVAVFLGIPFAKPPLGPLRFAPPQPAEPWSFVKNATSYPPMCIQDPKAGQFLSDLLSNRKENISLMVSEDCLYLNIYTPADLTKKNRLPVMVWIFGGGLVVGAASTYDGKVLAAHENVVVVTIQHRWASWDSSGDEHSRGNWGNPGSVTIFGESSGGESVSVLIFSPLSKNLFHRAISESGVALTHALLEDGDIKPLAEKIANTAGCQTTNSAVMVHCLRQKTEEELLETSKMNFLTLDFHGDPRKRYPHTPTVIDGVVLPETPEELQAERKFLTVPYIVGINKKEFGWFLPTVRRHRPLGGTHPPKSHIPKELIPEATEKYLGGTEDPVKKKDLFLDLMGDVMFGVPSVIVARHHRDAGAPTYMYEFQYRPSFSSDMKPKTVIGDHGDELFSVLGAPFLKEGASEEEIRLSKMMMKFWANFARSGAGDDQGQGLPHWPEYNQKEGYLQIGANTQAAQKLKDKEVVFWTNLFKKAAEQPPQTEDIEL